MKNGDCELLNLCFPTPFKSDLKLKEIYRYSSAPLKIMLKNNFVCFTPEIFVEIENGVIKTFPMKDTIDAKIKNAEEKLLNDKKEFDEQMMVTKLMQNDLSAVASSVEIKKFRYFSEIKTQKGKILQTSSEICGILNEHYLQNFGDLFEKILPAGSISGAPKNKTCEIIRKNELVKRGFYSGVFVYFDGKILRSFVMIRFVQKISKNKFRFFSGGGITLKSKAKKEFDELNKKAYFTFWDDKSRKLWSSKFGISSWKSKKFNKKEPNFDFKNIIKAPNNGLFRAKVIYDENGNLVDCRLFKYKMRNFKNFKILKSDVNYERKFLDRSALDEIFAQRGANDDVLIEKTEF